MHEWTQAKQGKSLPAVVVVGISVGRAVVDPPNDLDMRVSTYIY